LGRGVLPVRNRGRDCGRSSVFRSLLISTSAIAVAAFTAASPGVAQTAAEPATADQKKLPPISVSGQHPVKPGAVKKPRPDAVIHPAPNASGTPSTQPSQSQPLAGVPMTPLNTVAASASRLGLPVLQTPASVDIVSTQTIQDQGYRTTTDTAQGAVGVLAGDAAGAPANFSTRGFSFGEVNVLYNGIWTGPSDITARWMDTANLEQVEFLKGPSSLMTGLNAIGGSVNYVSRQPTTGPIQNETDASVDSMGSIRSHFGSGGSTPVQGLDYRFDATGSKLNSFIDGDFRDLTDLSAQFNYRVTNNFKTFVAVEYKKDSGHAYWGTPMVPTSFAGSHAISGVVSGTAVNEFDSSIIGPVTIDNRTTATNYNVADNATGAQDLWLRSGFEWTPLSNVTVKDQVYYYQAKRNWLDSETYAFDTVSNTMIDRDRFFVTHNQHLVGNNADFSWDSTLFGMENRLAAQLQTSRNWITFVEEGNPNDFNPDDTVAVINPSPGVYGLEDPDTRNSRLDDLAGSFEDRLKITSQFALIGGVRLEDFRLARDGINFDGTVPAGQPFTKNWAPVSYRAAYTYEPIPNLVFYSMYATAYDPAVAGIFSITPASSLQLTSARTYETGAKQVLWDGKAEWTVAAYDILQHNVFVPVSTTVDDLAGAVSTKGIEVAGAVRPIEGLKLWGNFASTHARFDDFDVWTGNTPPDVAPIIVNAGASYRFDHWRWPVEFGGSVRHVGDRYVFQDNLTTMNAYTTADAYTFVDIPGRDLPWRTVDTLRVTFRVRNLTNAVYAQWADPGLADQILLGAPRTYEVAASAKW
jgi:iron complex outermembrane recepter protein